MKKIMITCLGVILGLSLSAQILTPIEWKFTSKKVSDKVYEVHCTATLDEGWHIYSQYTPKGGPLPTVFTFSDNPSLVLEGKVQEVGRMEKKWEEVFEVGTLFYEKKVDFVQKVKKKGKAPASLSGMVEFMACDAERCLPPEEVPFKVVLE